MSTDKPTLSLHQDLPDYMGVPRRPDGSLSRVSVTVDAEDIQSAIMALGHLRDNITTYGKDWIRLVLSDEEKSDLAFTEGPVPDYAMEAVQRIHDEFLELKADVDFNLLLPAGVTACRTKVTITAPSIMIGMQVFLEMMDPQRMNLMTRELI